MTQAQILHRLIKHRKLKDTTKILCFHDDKSTKVHVNIIRNISKALSMFGKSRKYRIQANRRDITTIIVAPRTSRIQMVKQCQNFFMFQEKCCVSILNSGCR